MEVQHTTHNELQTLSASRCLDNISLQSLNTMNLNVVAKHFYEINSLKDIDQLIKENVFTNNKTLILGGGSNILFQDEYFDGTVIHSNLKGITINPEDSLESQNLRISESQNLTIVRCMSGEVWKDFVDFTISHNLYGLENLVDIPGSVGASPVQNIGAYGVEVKDCINCVYAIDLTNGNEVTFKNEDCHFSYRDSIFKREENKKYFIVAIDFKLKTNADLNLEYGNIKDYIEKNNITPTLSSVANAIKTIRADKLPEVGVVGSVGSFFQNPIVDIEIFNRLKEIYPEMPSYPNDKGVKIPAGWLIDKAGWKGYKEKHVGVWDKQALVLVHYGGGKPEEILNLMRKIQHSVKEKFGIEIKPEVNIV